MATDDLKNVAVSVLQFFADNLASVAAVDYPGAGLDTEKLDEWFQVTLTGPIPSPSRRGSRTEAYLITCNCFARTGQDDEGSGRTNMHRHLELAGEFREVFQQVDVPIQDWDAVGDPVIDYLRCEEVAVTVVHDLRETSLQQAAATVDGLLTL